MFGVFCEKIEKKQRNEPWGRPPTALNATSVAQWAVRSAQASGDADKASTEIEAASGRIEADSIKIEGPSARLERPSMRFAGLFVSINSDFASGNRGNVKKKRYLRGLE